MNKELRLFIEQVIKNELEEKAVPHDEAVTSGLALYITDVEGITTIILYNPKLLNSEELIYGMIEMEESFKCNAWKIVTSSAKKGYGPMMYDIAFSFAGNKGLMSDRSSVSSLARNVWNYNFTTRKDDFSIVPLEQNCKFAGRDSIPSLNHKYILKNPINFQALVDSHHHFLNTFRKREQQDVIHQIEDKADAFFKTKFRGRDVL